MTAGLAIQITCIDNGILVAVPGDNTAGRKPECNHFPRLQDALDYIATEFSESDFNPKISE